MQTPATLRVAHDEQPRPDPPRCWKCGSPPEPYGKGRINGMGVCGWCYDDMGDEG